MKRTLLNLDTEQLPSTYRPLVQNAPVWDSSCSREARVIYIERDGGYFLKSAPAESLKREADMTRYFHGKGLATEVLDYRTEDGRDWFLTARVPGEDCTDSQYLSDPERLCDTWAELLRMLHETSYEGCPVPDRMAAYFELVEKNREAGEGSLSFFGDASPFSSVEEAWQTVREGRTCLASDTLIHGDYCLPNLLLRDWRFSGFIDLGNGGVGDRHVDLFWGAWTLRYNLHTDAYRERFFDAYGRDRVDRDCLRTVAAAEVFG